MQWSCKAGFHHRLLTSCHPFSKQMEKSFSLLFDVVILCSCEELTHSHFWTVTGIRAVTHKKPKRAAFPTSSDPPMAPLHSFLACNHLSPLSPECTYRTSSGGRPHHSQRENGEMRGQKLRGLFQIDARLIEHRFVLPWGVSEICRAILYLEHLNPKDRQIPTDFYFLAAPKYNKLPRVSQFPISLSEQRFCKGYGAIVEALKCHTMAILLQKHPGVQCTLLNRLSKRWDRDYQFGTGSLLVQPSVSSLNAVP